MNRSKSKSKSLRRRDLFSVFVGRLHKDVTEKEIHELFSGCGVVADFFIAKNLAGEDNYGFIRYGRADEAVRAIKELNGWPLKNKSIVVDVSHESADKLYKGLEDKVSLLNIDVDQTDSAVLDSEIPKGCISKIINLSRVKETYLLMNMELAGAQPKGTLRLDELERQIDKTDGAVLHLPYYQTEYKDSVTSEQEMTLELQQWDSLKENSLLTSRQFIEALEKIQGIVKELQKKHSTPIMQKQIPQEGKYEIRKKKKNSDCRNQIKTEMGSRKMQQYVQSDKKEQQIADTLSEKAADVKCVGEAQISNDRIKHSMLSHESSPVKAIPSKPPPQSSKKKLFKSTSSMFGENEHSCKEKTCLSTSENSFLMSGTLLELGKRARVRVQPKSVHDYGDIRDCSICLTPSPQKLPEAGEEGGSKSEQVALSWSLKERMELAAQEDHWDMKKGSPVFDPKDFASKLFCQFIPSPSMPSANSDFCVSEGNEYVLDGDYVELSSPRENKAKIREESSNENVEQNLVSDLSSSASDFKFEDNTVSPILASRLACITGKNKGLPSLGRGFPLCNASSSAGF